MYVVWQHLCSMLRSVIYILHLDTVLPWPRCVLRLQADVSILDVKSLSLFRQFTGIFCMLRNLYWVKQSGWRCLYVLAGEKAMGKREGVLIPSWSSGGPLSAASGRQWRSGNPDNVSPVLDCWMFSILETQWSKILVCWPGIKLSQLHCSW